MKIISAEIANEFSTHFKAHGLEKPMAKIFSDILMASIAGKTSCEAKIIIFDFHGCPYHVSKDTAKLATDCLIQLGYKINGIHTEGSTYYCFSINW